MGCKNPSIFFIQSSIEGHSGCFPVLAAVNVAICVTFQIRVLDFFGDAQYSLGSLVNVL